MSILPSRIGLDKHDKDSRENDHHSLQAFTLKKKKETDHWYDEQRSWSHGPVTMSHFQLELYFIALSNYECTSSNVKSFQIDRLLDIYTRSK